MPAAYPWPSAPATAILDQNFNLTLGFTPAVDTVLFPPATYDYWDIQTTLNAGPVVHTHFNAPVGYTGGSLTYTTILSAGTITLNMIAIDSSSADITNLWQTNGVNAARTFPVGLTPAAFTFSGTSILLGQALTVTLNTATYTGADQWQVLWPDNTNTTWLPLAQNVVTKSFSTLGGQSVNVVIQTRRNYSAVQYNPPTTLISQYTQQIFIVDQQQASTSSSQSGLTGDLGIGGQQGFEIVNATSGTVSPEPWEVIARAVVRDTVTNELKLLVPTSRFSNASSLFGTMAVDVFPMEGRPRMKELIEPPYELTVTANTETVPVKITSTAFPALYVGKSVEQATGGTFSLTASNGITPYIWSSSGLPAGLAINASGVLNGTPLELGVFDVTVAVQDSSSPFSIDEITFGQNGVPPLTVATDLLVEIAPGQVDANNTPLAQLGTTLGVAQVGTPYNVEMTIGNVDPVATIPGGLPPYAWSAPSGAFPTGLTIQTSPTNSLFGIISGTPSTYNSTTDFATTYSVTIQVTDSIGAKATQTYSMTLKPQALQFGRLNQTTVYKLEEFKLVVPVFGGKSPYTLNAFGPSVADANFYGTPFLVDGQIEIPIGGVTAATPGGFPTIGARTFSLQITDSNATTIIAQFSYLVETEISVINLVPAFLTNFTHPLDGSWALNDYSDAGEVISGPIYRPIPISGNLFSLGEVVAGVRLNLTAVGTAVGAPLTTTYTMPSNPNFASLVNQVIAISGFTNAANNGTYTVQATPAPTLTSFAVNNPNGVLEATPPPYTLTLASVAATTTLLSATISNSSETSGSVVTLTVSSSSFAVGQKVLLSGLSVATWLNGQTVTLIAPTNATTLTFNDPTTHGTSPSSADTGTVFLGTAVYVYSAATYGNGLNNAYAGLTFTVAGFTNVSNNGPFVCVSSTDATVTLLNSAAVVEAHAATAISPLAKALQVGVASNGFTIGGVLSNGIVVAVDPTNITLSSVPNVEFYGPAGGPPQQVVYTNAGASAIFSNAEERVDLVLLPIFELTSVVASTGSTPNYLSTYNGFITNGAGNTYAGQSFTITGFANAANNGTFICSASTNSTLVLETNTVLTIAESNTSAGAINQLSLEQVSRVYTTLSHDAPYASLNANIGTITTYDRPHIVGDVIGFNPRKAYFNSPQVPGFNTTAYGDGLWAATVEGGSSLPPGLSLDANTGLVYGILSGTTTQPSVINYVDSTGSVHGSITVNWQTYLSSFQLTDNDTLDSLVVGTAYTGGSAINAFTAPAGVTLTSASLAPGSGPLPTGLTVGLDGTNTIVQVFGTPSEAGFFDCWFLAQSSNGQSAYAYHRVSAVIADLTLTITGWADVITPGHLGQTMGFPLPNAIIGIGYEDFNTSLPISLSTLTNTGIVTGVPPYTYSTTPSFPQQGVTLALTGTTAGQFGGTATGPAGTVSFTATVTDSALNTYGPIPLSLTFQASGLSIVAPATIPTATSGVAYTNLATLVAAGGTPPRTFSISPVSANPLPTGLTISAAGVISGTTLQSGYSKAVTFRVTDSLSSYSDRTYTVMVQSGLALKSGIDFEDALVTPQYFLGFVDAGSVTSITVRPNLSFYVVATGVVSTSTATMTANTDNSNITAKLNTPVSGVCEIELSGSGFNVGAGTYSVTVTVVDSGVQASHAFTWTVYNDGTMALKASNATPTRLTTPT